MSFPWNEYVTHVVRMHAFTTTSSASYQLRELDSRPLDKFQLAPLFDFQQRRTTVVSKKRASSILLLETVSFTDPS